jgi:phosphoribosylformylglycinamidine synthase subunit PurQ / glutaminase
MKPAEVDRQLAELRGLPAAELAQRRAAVQVLVLTGLGLNCEVETAEAFRRAGATAELVHLLDLLDGKRRFADFKVVAFVGGFAFGDHLGAGFVFANKIRWRLYDQVVELIEAGGMALGICNGFQMMARLGLLPGLDGDYRTQRVTLAPNDRLGYWDAWVRLRTDPDSPCLWTRGIESLELPSRHGEGKLLSASPEVAERLRRDHLAAVGYVDENGEPTEEWPANPSGSAGGVAGLCDPSGRLFGLMPHPDAFLYAFQHPSWYRERQDWTDDREGAGMAIFRNGVDAAAAGL